MATQAVVSLVDGKQQVLIKVVVGCNGFNADELVAAIEASSTKMHLSAQDVFEMAKQAHFGCPQCCVVIERKGMNVVTFLQDAIPQRYFQTFDDPKFNPRWERGTASHIRVIDVSAQL